jgi:hypothetical protein
MFSFPTVEFTKRETIAGSCELLNSAFEKLVLYAVGIVVVTSP